ncbi:hypothetical protein [Pseudoalteromonas luteoviolacea]|uniref:N-acetyltransferase domain-containing protein n=1 Tax=Pseudoalteromonas luteoviolacea H33 TaxID=1365251 RepID=A0A167F4P7_9GAMM|nr:hypothetical protein [Pseudoalteromonas luteoviolacea]KZN51637.1 hypothetical protein N476_12480 [Pseudoalteromonas luteoviolacea H33]KZN79106.1 hypothetical protein N477_06290 [Pseudoalteromonas luteoviolacea H33-S]MBQ4878218.1 hypothetical protein [Pseudoalteromonas luteoviolacea]MBQ4907373.1 hypothetical protein [Pseudoalteromonas luteoviolacea]
MYAQIKHDKRHNHRLIIGHVTQQTSAPLIKGLLQKAAHKYGKFAKTLSRQITGDGKDLCVKEGKLKYKIFNYQGAKILEITDLVSDKQTKGTGVKLMKHVMEIGKAAGCDIVRLIAESSGYDGRPKQAELLQWYTKRGLHNVKPGGKFGRWMVGEIDDCLKLIDGTLARFN